MVETIYFIIDHAELQRKVERLRVHKISEGGWVRYYIDPEAGDEWTYYAHRGSWASTPVLRREPFPDRISEQLKACLTTGRRDDAIGLAGDLEPRFEQWAEIILFLEAHLEELHAEQV